VVVETRRKGYKETSRSKPCHSSKPILTSHAGTFRPRHIVQATGLNGDPRVPRIPGVGGFQGSVKHSSEFSSGASYAGRKVIVVGTGNSGHDIAHDACMSGANVTMIQRSHTYVVSVPSTLKMFQVRYNEGRATEDSDILSSAIPTTLSQRQGGDAAANFAKEDAKLLSALNAAGFKTHPGPEFPSLLAITIAKTRGFYLNTGTSELIISQKIAVKQGQEISRITPTSMVFPDGSEIEADEIIFATGYANVRSRTRTIFGDSVADKIQPIGGFDEQGEIRGVWRRSGHDGFWVGAGSFYVSRYYSKLLALQIKMIEKGLVAL
jgi:cation diffusion facilitator CzcD-associated flavoprotein CzcO